MDTTKVIRIRKLFAVLLLMTMMIGCLAPIEFYAYAADEESTGTEEVSTPAPGMPKSVTFTAGYESVQITWKAVSSKEGKVYYEVRDGEDKVIKTGITKTSYKAKFDPYPGDKNGKGKSGTAKKATFSVYSYILDPADNKTKIYSKPVTKKNIEVIHPMYVRVKVLRKTKIYYDKSSNKKFATAKKGSKYIVIGGSRIRGENKRVVIKINNKLRYIKSSDVKIEKMWYKAKTGSNPYKKAGFSKQAVENFINDKGLTSKPKMGPKRLIWVNTYNQRVYLFAWKNKKWVIDSRYPNGILCNTGKELTPYGAFKVTSKWEVKVTTGTRWWCIFNAVGIHQKLGGTALGQPGSGGCVRIPTVDAKLFYEKLIKKGTTVFVY